MLIYAGLVKLTPDWLAGEPLGLWLRAQAESTPPCTGCSTTTRSSWPGPGERVVLHVLGAPLLLWRAHPPRRLLVYCVFQFSERLLLQHRHLPVADHRRDDDVLRSGTGHAWAPDGSMNDLKRCRPRFRGPCRPRGACRPCPFWASRCGWRSSSRCRCGHRCSRLEVRWSGDGHRYSWRMRIYDPPRRGPVRRHRRRRHGSGSSIPRTT